jgi:cyanophycin synthetase
MISGINIISPILIILIKVIYKIQSYIKNRIKRNKNRSALTMYNSYYLIAADQLKITTKIFDNLILQFRKEDKVMNIWSAWTDLDGEPTLMIAGDKPLCYDLLQAHNIPIPNYKVLKNGDYKGALHFKRECNSPVVIKPARNTGDSAGVFVKLQKNTDILYAVLSASALSDEIIIEKFVGGINYRLLFCRGEFLAASSRIPRYIIPDGVHNIRYLITKENKTRLKNGLYLKFSDHKRPIKYKIPIDKETNQILKEQGYTLQSIPQKNTKVPLQRICHWFYGGEYYDVSTEISDEIIEICKSAVSILGIKLAGVDIIAKDIRNVTEGSFVINEVNTTPALLVHYEVQNQERMRPVAQDILKSMFDLE